METHEKKMLRDASYAFTRGRVVRLRRDGHSYPLIAHLGGSWRETEKAPPVSSSVASLVAAYC